MRRAFGRIIDDVQKLSQPQMTTPYIGILIFGGILSILFLGFIFLLVSLYSVRFIMWSDKNIDLAVKSNMWKMRRKYTFVCYDEQYQLLRRQVYFLFSMLTFLETLSVSCATWIIYESLRLNVSR